MHFQPTPLKTEGLLKLNPGTVAIGNGAINEDRNKPSRRSCPFFPPSFLSFNRFYLSDLRLDGSVARECPLRKRTDAICPGILWAGRPSRFAHLMIKVDGENYVCRGTRSTPGVWLLLRFRRHANSTVSQRCCPTRESTNIVHCCLMGNHGPRSRTQNEADAALNLLPGGNEGHCTPLPRP